MVGIWKYQARAKLIQLRRGKGFDGCLRANRREDRRLQNAVRSGEFAGSGIAILCDDFVVENLNIFIDS